MLTSSPMILASIFHLWPGSHEPKWFAGPPKLQISLSYCPTGLFQSMDGRCRPCVLRLGSNEATPCKGNQERVGYKMATRPFLSDKMPKEAILNFICIHHLTTCQQLHQEQSVQGAGQQMVFHPGSVCRCRNKVPPTSFQLIKRHGPEMDTWIKQVHLGVSTRNGATHKMDSWLLISSYMVKSTKMGWFASASIESSRFLRPTTSTEPPSQGSDCPQSPHTWAALDSCHIGQVASQWRRHQSTSPS